MTPMGVPDPQAGVLNLCTCSDPVPNSFTTRKGRIHSPFHVPRVRFGSHILLDVPPKHEIFYIAQNSIFYPENGIEVKIFGIDKFEKRTGKYTRTGSSWQ